MWDGGGGGGIPSYLPRETLADSMGYVKSSWSKMVNKQSFFAHNYMQEQKHIA